jgi:hypothetical protein
MPRHVEMLDGRIVADTASPGGAPPHPDGATVLR